MKARDIIFTALVGFLVTWSALSAFSLVQALVGFTDTYAELVTKYPTLATNEARQATLQNRDASRDWKMGDCSGASRAACADRKVVTGYVSCRCVRARDGASCASASFHCSGRASDS
jgi:hypothetical protein